MSTITSRGPAEKIRLERLQRGLSQENMADLLNLSTTAYGDIERGKTDLTLSRLSQIASVLDVSPLTLLSDEAVTAQVIEPKSDAVVSHELETLRLTVEKQEVELDKLRLEADYWKRKYDERIAMELLRSMGVEQKRERIGF
ncbi:helix-turn-helix transcriptional regulator [Spirosoma sp. KCTC 42546]|uniref:helix-turn-helix domain-containing protein n=1 Tax=Spirosoma sp. KCTC 42546 TaxID=2520506 RepID=UPI001157D0B9|nr:helix-turn-helix transcriptional regulator [Spirosoma sp. KCTC 42546]QDK78917.1 helix-turn-helix transcriptional regulator [Spirosoma sp. KCTC 42546]